MAIPDFQALMLPLLEHLGDGAQHPRKEIAESLADHFGLTDAEKQETVASGGTVINSRTWWALTHLYQAGLLERPARGVFVLSQEGRVALEAKPSSVNMTYLMQYPKYADFRKRKGTKKAPDASDSTKVPASPQDLLDQAVEENHAAVSTELLAKVRQMDPAVFERLVIRLLRSMGYGTSGSLEHTGKSGDAGIDGIISQDPLGLDRIYLQAKRYAADNIVQRPAVQGFVGALMGAQGDRGVFITSSSFSAGAKAEADKVNARLELIDGERLAQLLVGYGVGVQPDTVVTLHRIDEDFFEAL